MLLSRLFMACFLLLASVSLQAEDRNAALLASSCAACHGTQGHSVGGMPSLAGLDRLYFIEQMQLFQRGERPATVMMQHARGYSEEEIRLLADYFANQK
jgi:cytochrome c553